MYKINFNNITNITNIKIIQYNLYILIILENAKTINLRETRSTCKKRMQHVLPEAKKVLRQLWNSSTQ